MIRGDRGEIADNSISYLKDFQTPLHLEFIRHETGQEGNLEGKYLKGIQLGTDMIFTNPFVPARLSDDEIAVGTCLLRMAEYVETGKEFYPLAEACQDHYLNLTCAEALETGKEIETKMQPWAGA